MEGYEEYEKMDGALAFEDMVRLHREMLQAIGDDEDGLELYDELLLKAVEYAGIRARWSRMSRLEKQAADEGRTAKHDSLIVKCNQLARYLKQQGRDTSWREELGYEEERRVNRKRVGDMGCYLAFVSGLLSR